MRIHMRGIRLWVFFLVRPHVHHTRFLLWLLLRRRHRLLLRMLLRFLRVQLSLRTRLRFMLMPMRRFFPLTMRLTLLTLSGLMMMRVAAVLTYSVLP